MPHLPRLDHRNRAIRRRQSDIDRSGTFSPTQIGAVTSWLRLSASTPVSGEYESVVDVLNSNPVVQTDADRKPAAGTSANSLPTMVFDGTDAMVWPLVASTNNKTDKLGFFFWFKPGSTAANQRLLSITGGGNGASVSKLIIAANGTQLDASIFVTDATGRTGSRAGVFAAGTWVSVYVQYDDSRGGDANLAVWVNGVSQTLSYANIGVGATLTTLPQPTGNAIIGARNDSDTPTNPILDTGELGPNWFTLGDNLTQAEITNLNQFEVPT